MEWIKTETGFEIACGGQTYLKSDADWPMIFAGKGEESIQEHRGYFDIKDHVIERLPLAVKTAEQTGQDIRVNFSDILQAEFHLADDRIDMKFQLLDPSVNRFWLRLPAEKEEACYGCGEQFSYFNLRGRNFPLWSSEPGVGRDKKTYLTWECDTADGSGGDYYHTYFPQTTFVSSRHYYFHAENTAYADFDFRNEAYHELEFWALPETMVLERADSFPALMQKLTDLLGRVPQMPDWVYDGIIIGVQGGTERSFHLADRSLRNGIQVCGIWCQDWQGKRVTSFGKRLQWDWRWDEKMYPGLPEKIKEYREKGIRFLGYTNPYLVQGGQLFQEALEKDYFVKNDDGSICLVDFGEFDCGIPDLTNPEAYEWFKNRILKQNMIDFGLSGWMADFGEYLPSRGIKLHSGKPAMIEHNHWPALWAKCNFEALQETDTLSKEVIYFMRSGAIGSQRYCTLMWNGDQSVDFTRHDGLPSAIAATLSAGIIGCGISHSDIGGYTSMFENCRTKEVFQRWADMAAFTPVMRTHESNRPDTNFQYYDDADTMELLAKQVQIHVDLKPYMKDTVEEYTRTGVPAQRPLFMHYEEDARGYEIQNEYLLGRDLLVAPVYESGAEEWSLYLPEDQWVHLWTGQEYAGGDVTVKAPVGQIPVFYRKDSKYCALFESIRQKYGC